MEVERFEEFFRDNYEHELLDLASQGKKALIVDFSLLEKFDMTLAEKLLNGPEEMLDAAKKALSNFDLPEGSIKIAPRFKNIPESKNIRIRNLRSANLGKFLTLEGIVKRASEVNPEVAVVIYACPDCGSKIKAYQTERISRPPSFCDCGRKSGFKEIDKKLFDARWITIEEPYEIAEGEKQGSISVFLRDDLNIPLMQRKCDPGNRLKINGVLKEMKKFERGKEKTQLTIYMEANYVEPTEIEWEEITVSDEDEQKIKDFAADPEIYEKIVKSIAPSIYGMKEVKKAIMLQMFGGVQHETPDKVKVRGDIHILLLGDPSVAKTQLLKLVSSVIPRGKYVSGRGATAAGLTASVVKDELMGGWALEAGAMILANKGVIAIDEFDKISKEDQIAMHEAMSTQTISIAKASIIATLPAKVAVLAGANPKLSRFDPGKSVADQIDIPDTLLSRFDLKFALRDIPDKIKDEKLASHILETRLNPSRAEPIIAPNFLRKYIAYTKSKCLPKMTKEAAEALKHFYLEMRSQSEGNMVAITLRQNEALMRLSEASAKIRLSDIVEISDAQRAIDIMRFSLMQLGYDSETGKFDVDKLEGSVSASQRSKINKILDILRILEKELGKPVAKEEILAAAQEEAIDAATAEETLSRLKREGMIFEPKFNFLQRA